MLATLGFSVRADELREMLQAISVEVEVDFLNAEKAAPLTRGFIAEQ